MSVSPGQRLGPYEILSLIGEGGMGKVYKAKDTRLDRTVAIKVLPDASAAVPEVRLRFEREARAVSSLNHPNICALYDVGRQDGVDYLVMEYLEGQTLADRLTKGPLPLDEALRSAIEIVSALDVAQRQGIVHRDLKPANIFLTASGTKVLDFGLAKVRQPRAAIMDGHSVMETLTTPLTVEGTIAGTLQYMAPEQLEGKDADSRSDLFAFGAVFYEMITGRRAFEAGSHAALITRIMSGEPAPLSTIQPLVSPSLDHVVRTCLAKNPSDRWQTAHDLLVQLKWVAGAGSQAGVPAPLAAQRKSRERLLWASIAALLLGMLAVSFVHLREKPADVRAVRFQIYPPPNTAMTDFDAAVISPDGRRLVFVATEGAGKRVLWLRALDTLSIQPLAGTENAYSPFWSPDSRFIGFFADQKLKKIDLAGTPPQTLGDVGFGYGGAWNQDGTIVIGRSRGPLHKIPAAGGEATPLLQLDASRQEESQRWPTFLPDGRQFMYLSRSTNSDRTEIRAGSLGSSETRSVLPFTSNVSFSPPGFLLYARQETLMAQPFDAGKLRVTGDPFPIAEGIGRSNFIQRSFFSVSDTGLLIWRGAAAANAQLATYTRDGKRLGPIGEPQMIRTIALSPDERRLALERTDAKTNNADIWVIDLASHIFSRVTTDPSSDADQVWSPDGRELIFSSRRKGSTNLYRKVMGGAPEELLFESAESKYPEQWLADGSILYINQGGKSFFRLPLAGDRKPVVLFQSEFDKDEPIVSPDGRSIAYNSLESGRWEVYLATFPDFTEQRQISNGSGCQPQWRKDGKELFYLTLEGRMMAVDIKPRNGSAGAALEASVPSELFRLPIRVEANLNQYAVTGDGRKFIVLENANQGPTPITVFQNWHVGIGH